ncbi:MAG TPA: NrsF family protein [Bryobacteraceae bacterium]|nr:NrsF family protein [Bryobacteraceae bacterium]
MKDQEIDNLLKRAAGAQPEVDAALVDGVARSLGSSARPVRPLPPAWLLGGALVLVCVSMAVAGAMILGPFGFRKMSAVDMAAIFPVLGLLIWVASALCAAEAVPGSPRPVAPWVLGVCGCLALAAVFGLLFHDYGTESFVAQGIRCLTAGLVQAVPASAGTWWVLRRGFAVNSLAAGFAQGALAGLAGVTMLEIHCPNFETWHVIVWHISVLPVSGALGMVVAWIGAHRSRGRAAPG